jgi:hypothetical protein
LEFIWSALPISFPLFNSGCSLLSLRIWSMLCGKCLANCCPARNASFSQRKKNNHKKCVIKNGQSMYTSQ